MPEKQDARDQARKDQEHKESLLIAASHAGRRERPNSWQDPPLNTSRRFHLKSIWLDCVFPPELASEC